MDDNKAAGYIAIAISILSIVITLANSTYIVLSR